MYRLPTLGVSVLDLGNTAFSYFQTSVENNFTAIDGAVGDVSLFMWGGRSGKAAGTVVAVSPVSFGGLPTVAEAYDTDAQSNEWRTRAVGVLLSNFPDYGDRVRVRHYGRVSVDKKAWDGLTRAGQPIYLKMGVITDPDTHGLMTPVADDAHALHRIQLGICSYGPHVIFRPKLVTGLF